MPRTLSDPQLKDWLHKARRIAVIGLSPMPARPSYGVTRYMIEAGYEIFGVRPTSPPQILGRPCVEKLADLHDDIDIFDIFRNSDALEGLVDEIADWMKAHPRPEPRLLWLQEGVMDANAEDRAEKLGLQVVSNLCILKEHARLA